MVLGNFLLLCGVNPDEVNHWYLSVYADAYEWVEMPNVTGMILYAEVLLPVNHMHQEALTSTRCQIIAQIAPIK